MDVFLQTSLIVSPVVGLETLNISIFSERDEISGVGSRQKMHVSHGSNPLLSQELTTVCSRKALGRQHPKHYIFSLSEH